MPEKAERNTVQAKIWKIEELASELERLRSSAKKIVHCHGVFDLLHIGHIRHLRGAKKLGDVLVVTVTPDEFVNKGPHRPAFSQEFRAEALAALECVDFVSLNKWPTAVEAIRCLRPDFYAKGPDYADPGKDRTGGILLEEEAVRSVGGRWVVTEDISFSSSHLINRHLPVLSQEASDYLARFSRRYSSQDVIRHLEAAQSLKVLVVGEAILDEYQYCLAIGKSSKEPMLALKSLSFEKFAGGILAVANHVSSFCEQPGLITFLGSQNPQEDFIRNKLRENVEPTFFYKKDSPTIVKRRFIESYFFTKLFVTYEINDNPLSDQDNRLFCGLLAEKVPQYDVVLVVDFGHGMMTPEAIELLCQRSRFLAVNAQSNAGNLGYHTISRYPRADYICIAESEIRMEARDRYGDIKRIVSETSQRFKAERVMVTRGKYGSLGYSPQEGFIEVPAFANQVVDRMGAGDAFLALTALCAVQKVPLELIGFIGNVVGAEAVATVGHRSYVERVALYKHMESLLK